MKFPITTRHLIYTKSLCLNNTGYNSHDLPKVHLSFLGPSEIPGKEGCWGKEENCFSVFANIAFYQIILGSFREVKLLEKRMT